MHSYGTELRLAFCLLLGSNCFVRKCWLLPLLGPLCPLTFSFLPWAMCSSDTQNSVKIQDGRPFCVPQWRAAQKVSGIKGKCNDNDPMCCSSQPESFYLCLMDTTHYRELPLAGVPSLPPMKKNLPPLHGSMLESFQGAAQHSSIASM